jgi:hypothetical protein
MSCHTGQILELHAGHVEEQLLNQARVVSMHAPLPVWILGSTLIRLKVTATESSPPSRCVLLAPNTEVIVAPKVRPAAAPPVSLAKGIFAHVRVLPTEWLDGEADPYVAYVDAATAGRMQVQHGAICVMEAHAHAAADRHPHVSDDASAPPHRACVLVRAHARAYAGHVHVAWCVRAQCRTPCGMLVRLTRLVGTPPHARSVTLAPVVCAGQKKADGVQDSFMQWLQAFAPISKRAHAMCEGTLVCLRHAGGTRCGQNGKGEDGGCAGPHVRVSFRSEGDDVTKRHDLEVFAVDAASLCANHAHVRTMCVTPLGSSGIIMC